MVHHGQAAGLLSRGYSPLYPELDLYLTQGCPYIRGIYVKEVIKEMRKDFVMGL